MARSERAPDNEGENVAKQAVKTTMVVLGIAVLAAGCGGSTKSIADVQACLKKVEGMTVEKAPAKDSGVEEGVFATTDLTKGGKGDFTMAMAANVKSEKDVKTFQEQSKEFAGTDKTDKTFAVETGVDGKYVWVAGGAKDSETYKASLDCVKV